MSLTGAQQLLDRAYTRDGIAALAAEPGSYATALAGQLAPVDTLEGLGTRDGMLAEGLGRIDAAVVRAMRVLLDHALAADTSLGAPTRNVFAATVATYTGRLELLAQRVHDVAARGGAAHPGDVVDAVVGAARAAIALRDGLRAGVLSVIAAQARDAVPVADRHARDRQLDEPARKKWSAARRDLEMLAARPELVAAAPWEARIAEQPAQLDEPEAVPEPTLAELIELD